MRSPRRTPAAAWVRVVSLAAWCTIGGCGGSLQGRVAAVVDARSSAFGAWAFVRFHDHARSPDLQGEIIAAGEDSLMLLTSDGLTVLSMARLIPAFAELHEIGQSYEILFAVPAVRIESPGRQWKTLARAARFPQGLPAEVDRAALRLPRAAIPSPPSAFAFAGARGVMVSDFSAERAILRYGGDAKELGHDLAIMLRDELRASGVPAEVGAVAASSDLIIDGRIISVDEGSAAGQAVVGTGQATMAVKVMMRTSVGQSPTEFYVNRSSTRGPSGMGSLPVDDSPTIIRDLMSAIARDVAERIRKKMKR